MPGYIVPLATQSKLAVTNGAVVSLTLPTVNIPITHAMINVQTGDVRITVDGTTPVTGAAGTGIGTLVLAGGMFNMMEPLFDYRSWLKQFKVIAAAATSATLDIAYFHHSAGGV